MNHSLFPYDAQKTKEISKLSPEFTGNIRELENSIERAVILCPGEQISPKELPPQMLPDDFEVTDTATLSQAGQTLKDVEKKAIMATLKQTDGNKSKSAKMLGIARQTLLNKIKEYNL